LFLLYVLKQIFLDTAKFSRRTKKLGSTATQSPPWLTSGSGRLSNVHHSSILVINMDIAGGHMSPNYVDIHTGHFFIKVVARLTEQDDVIKQLFKGVPRVRHALGPALA